jgi:hypothetical protein
MVVVWAAVAAQADIVILMRQKHLVETLQQKHRLVALPEPLM